MKRIMRLVLLSLGLVSTIVGNVRADLTDSDVRQSIERAVTYLKAQQNQRTGGWVEYSEQPGGLTALITLALINAGVEADDPAIRKAVAYLRQFQKPQKTYATALRTMVLCQASPQKDLLQITTNVRFLESIQIKTGTHRGSWAYSANEGRGDNSNAQFALLGLHEAERIGVEVDTQTWEAAQQHWLKLQKPDGSWGYLAKHSSSGSMTCAGTASLIITSGQLSAGDARVVGDRVQCCGNQDENAPIERALEWLGKKFTVEWNPSGAQGSGGGQRSYWLYYLYAIERVGRLSGRRFLGAHDWYRTGAAKLLAEQASVGYWKGHGHAETNPLVATSMALLFLSKGRRPVLISQLKTGEQWNSHRAAVQNLTRRVEKTWQRDLTWQTIDMQAASAADLVETPVLFISGRGKLNFTAKQKANLTEYVNQGGFIFAEACCGDAAFDQSFRELLGELFPDSGLRLLPPDHAVWFAEGKVDPKYTRPLYGINACCRTSVVYCPDDLSCYWELSRGTRKTTYPAAVNDEVEACLQIGENVLAYATNRQLKAKLDRPQIALSDGATREIDRGTLRIPKLSHTGGSDDAPHALTNLLRELHGQIQLPTNLQPLLLAADNEQLLDHPIIFMHGRRGFRFSDSERAALRMFLQRGGFLFADSICASTPFAESLRREMKAIFPENPLQRLPANHALLTAEFRGFDIRKVTLRDPKQVQDQARLDAKLQAVTPVLETLQLGDRVCVVFSPYDISCAMENHASLECKGYVREDAARIGINVIMYALQQ